MSKFFKSDSINKIHSLYSKWSALVILMLAQTIVVFDNATLMIAADSLAQSLSMSLSELQQANAIYPMIGAIFMIAGGMLGLIIGWKFQFQLGIFLLIISSFASALAPNATVFIFGARVLAGLGGGLMVPALFGYCTSHYKGKDQALAFGFIAGSIGLTGMLSPLMLGGIIDQYGYQASFYVVALHCLFVFLLSMTLSSKSTHDETIKFDFGGMFFIGMGLLLIIIASLYVTTWGVIYPLSDISILGYAPTIPIALLGATFLSLFFRWERYKEALGQDVIFPKSLRGNNQVWLGMFYCAMTYALYPTMAFITVTYLQLTGMFTATESGIIVGLNALGMVISSVYTPSKLSHWSSKQLILLANILCAIGISSMWLAYGLGSISAIIYIALFVFGLGCGIYASHSPYIITSALSQKDAEQSCGVQTTSRNFGKALGVAILGTVLALSYSDALKNHADQSEQLSYKTSALISSAKVVPFSNNDELTRIMVDANISETEQYALLELVEISRLEGLKCALAGFITLLLLSVFIGRHLPSNSQKESSSCNLV